MRMLLLSIPLLTVVLARSGWAAAAEPPAGQKARGGLTNLTAENLIRRFDKNGDGVLTRDEVPPQIAQRFDEIDTNGDGKLDKQEIEAFLNRLRERMAANKKGNPGSQGVTAAQAVDMILKRLDTNHDGRISKEEARGPLAKNFDKIDTNKDGYLDRKELLRIAPMLQKFLAGRPGGQPANGKTDSQARQSVRPAIPDFDALDSDADGRLSRKELEGTPFAEAFDEMDTNKDGKIDRKEFEAYLQKEANKKAAADKK